MDMSKYIGEATAYDKKRMLERKEPLKQSYVSLSSSHTWARREFVESGFDSFRLVQGGGLWANVDAFLADKSHIRRSRAFCTRRNEFANLKKASMIRHIGPTKGGFWEINQ